MWTRRLAGICVFFLAWEAAPRAGLVPADYFPPASSAAVALGGLATSPEFLEQLAMTWGRTLAGLAIAIALALAMAIVTGRYQLGRRMLEPLVEMLRVLPPPALVPLCIFALGLGARLYLFIIAFAALWPVYLGAANALAATEPVQLNTGRAFGYSTWEILLKLRLPSALPEIFTGVRLAAGIALLAAVASEMLAAKDGLGFMLYDSAFTLRVADMFAVMFVVGASGVLMQGLVALARRAAIGWHMRLAALREPL